MPSKEEQFEAKAQDLTTKVESKQSVSDELNSMPFQDRLAMARRMDEINADHRKTDGNLPDIQLTVEKDSGGQEHLTDMQAVKERAYWFDSSTDTYDLPKVAQHNMFDYVLDTRLTRDIEDSKHLGNGEDLYDGTGRRDRQ